MMRVCVCGGRDYADRNAVFAALNDIYPREVALAPLVIVEGGARGADHFAKEWAILGSALKGTDQIVHEPHPAQWTKYRRAAGPRRNQEMVDSGLDLLLAFPGGTGTRDMIRKCRKAGIEVREFV